MDWHNSAEKIKPYVVRIETPSGSGTGFLFAYSQTKLLCGIATALHVVDHANDWREPIKIIHEASGDVAFLTNADRAIFVDSRRDSASILFAPRLLPNLPGDLLDMVPKDIYRTPGQEVAWMGYPGIAYPELCFFRGSISAFVDSGDYYLVDGVAINGVSGGPLFGRDKVDNKIKLVLIGSVNAYLPNRVSGVALPGLLKAHDLMHAHGTIATLRDLEEAREKQQEIKNSEPPKPPKPEPPPSPSTP